MLQTVRISELGSVRHARNICMGFSVVYSRFSIVPPFPAGCAHFTYALAAPRRIVPHPKSPIIAGGAGARGRLILTSHLKTAAHNEAHTASHPSRADEEDNARPNWQVNHGVASSNRNSRLPQFMQYAIFPDLQLRPSYMPELSDSVPS